MPTRLLRFFLLASVPFVLPGCLFMGFGCGVVGSLVQSENAFDDVCPMFNGDCCEETPGSPYACGAPNAAKTFVCGSIHDVFCGCVEKKSARDGADAAQSFESSAVSAPITYTVPPFTYDLRFPFAGFETAHHLAFPVVLSSYQTFSGTVVYQPGFRFHGFTALGAADTVIGSYGMDLKSTDTINFALPIRAASADVAYADVDGDGHQGVLDPTIVHQGNVPTAGAHTFVLALPAGGDTMKGFARSFLAFRAHVSLAAGILGNPLSTGNVGVSGSFVSVDPDTGDANDGQGFTPIAATAAPIALPIAESPIALLDHFLCYKSKPSKGLVCGATATVNAGGLCASDADCGGIAGACGKNKFPKGVQATLGDRFTAFAGRAADVKKPLRLCTPAALDGTPQHDDTTHLRGYQIAVAKTAPKPAVVPNLAVVNQLGTLVLDVKAPDTLYVPVVKSLDVPAGALGPNTVDHYQCYKPKLRTKRCAGAPARACKSDLACGADGPCLGKFPKGLQVAVADQFTTGVKVFDVKKPTRLCTPALHGGSPVQSQGGQLMCYQVKPAASAAKHAPVIGRIHTNGVLGRERLDTVVEDEICLPSIEITTL